MQLLSPRSPAKSSVTHLTMLSPVTSPLRNMPTIPGLDDCNVQPEGRKQSKAPVVQRLRFTGTNSRYSPRQAVPTANQENDQNEAQLLSLEFKNPHSKAKVSHSNVPSTPTLSLLCSPRIISATTGFCTPTSSTGRVRFTFGDEQRNQGPSCRKILTFGHTGISKTCHSKAPASGGLPPTGSSFLGNVKSDSSTKKHSVSSPNIRIKRISHQEANQRRSRVQSSGANLHHFPDVMSSPCQKVASSIWNQDDHFQQVHSDSIFNDFEANLSDLSMPDLFSTSNNESFQDKELQESFDILDALTEVPTEISSFFADQTSQFISSSNVAQYLQEEQAVYDSLKEQHLDNSIGHVLTENESQALMELLCENDPLIDETELDASGELLQPNNSDYLSFLAKIKEPVEALVNPFVDSKEESDSDCEIYQDESASSDSEEDYSQEIQENAEHGESRAHSNSNNVLISERELFALYEETIQSHQSETKIKHYSPNSLAPNSNQSFTEAQIDQIHFQLQHHLQLMIQTISLLMEGKLFDVMICIKSHLQMLFELKYFDDFFILQINQLQQQTRRGLISHPISKADGSKLIGNSVFHVKGIDKLSDFYGLLKRFNQDFSFSFNAPSKIRLLPERYSTSRQLMYSKLQTNQLFIPPLLQKVMILFQEDFDINLKITWGPIKQNPKQESKNEINFSCENSRCKFFSSEDDLLLIGLKRYCLNWETIQNKLLPSKTAKQLAIRYKNLTTRRAPPNPIKEFHFSLGKPLDEQEEELLYKGVQHLGKDFAKISKLYLPYRPAAFLRKVWIEMDQNRRLNSQITSSLLDESDFILDDFYRDDSSCYNLTNQNKFSSSTIDYSMLSKGTNSKPKKMVTMEFSLEDALYELSQPAKQDVFDLEAELLSIK